MSFTTDHVNKRFEDAAERAADRIQLGHDPYMAAAYGGPGKAAAAGYGARVGSVIAGDARMVRIINQGRGARSGSFGLAQLWLEREGTYWVHCFSDTMPNPARYRVYVCAALAHTHTVLRQLLQGYVGRPLYFKVAEHHEAQERNDTIVSWHQTQLDAREWANIARANAALLEGDAPAGTFGGIDTKSVGIDTEIGGDTSTSRVARAAVEVTTKRLQKQILSNPYI